MCDTLHFSEWGCTVGLGRFARIMYIRTHSYSRFAPYKGEDYFCRKNNNNFFVTYLSYFFLFLFFVFKCRSESSAGGRSSSSRKGKVISGHVLSLVYNLPFYSNYCNRKSPRQS